MKIKKEQVFEIFAIVLFFIGAIFMIIGTLTDGTWATWTGLGILLVCFVFYMLTVFTYKKMKSLEKQESKKA